MAAFFKPTVAVICPLEIELRAVLTVFDHGSKRQWSSSGDHKLPFPYWPGTLHGRSAVAVCLKTYGMLSANSFRYKLETEFPSLEHRFLVGIAGGIPEGKADVRLGDVVIGTQIIKYDSGKWINGDLFPNFRITEAPKELDGVITGLYFPQHNLQRRLEDQLKAMRNRDPDQKFLWSYPKPKDAKDLLFKSDYKCKDQTEKQCSCDPRQTVVRVDRPTQSPRVHCGLIASGDQVMKDGTKRDDLKKSIKNRFEKDVLAVEMEAAALENYMSVRGICDYADSHKNKIYQDYAAAVAAACFIELLHLFPPPNHNVPNDDKPSAAPAYLPSNSVQSNMPERRAKSFPIDNRHDFTDIRRVSTDHRRVSTDHGRDSTNHIWDSTDRRDSSLQSYMSNSRSAGVMSETGSAISDQEHSSMAWALSAYRCEWTAGKQDQPVTGGKAELELHVNDAFDEPLKMTRRIVIHDSSQWKDPLSSWLPLDGVRVRVEGHKVHLEFSDCNGKAWRTVNGTKEYYSSYDPQHPNVFIIIDFLNSKSAENFSNFILYIDGALPGYQTLQVFQILAGTCSCGIARRTRNEPGTVNQAQEVTVIIIVVIDVDQEGCRVSSVFGLGSRINYDLNQTTGGMTIGLEQLKKATYRTSSKKSATWPPYWLRSNSDGRPEKIDYDKADVKLAFGSQAVNDWQQFMQVITGWRIMYWGNAQTHGQAQVVVWKKESQMRILCKTRNRSGDQKWSCFDLSGGQMTNEACSVHRGSESKTVTLKKVLLSEGSLIDRSMSVEVAPGSRSKKPSSQKLQFIDAGVAQDFEEQLTRLIADR